MSSLFFLTAGTPWSTESARLRGRAAASAAPCTRAPLPERPATMAAPLPQEGGSRSERPSFLERVKTIFRS